MISAWTKHLEDPDKKEQFIKSLKNSKFVLDRLFALLTEQEQAIDRSELDIKIYDNPNWSHKQAFKNGQRSVLASIKRLIDLDQEQK
jgi:hypothetical protein